MCWEAELWHWCAHLVLVLLLGAVLFSSPRAVRLQLVLNKFGGEVTVNDCFRYRGTQ